jgi:hypothetical protein
VRLPQQLTSPFQDRHLGLELADAFVGHGQFGLLGPVEAGQVTGVDQLLLAPAVDSLIADAQIVGDLSNPRPAATRSSTLRRNSSG